MSKIIDGRLVSEKIKEQLKHRIQTIQNTATPGLAVVMVGNRKDSEVYVKMKKNAAENIGIRFHLHTFESNVSTDALINNIGVLNNDTNVNGIIVQLPLPKHIDKTRVMSCIFPEKDVDGFNALNIGNLALEGHTPMFSPCTPLGVMELLKYYNISVKRKHIVILGKSNIVGLPMSLLLLKENSTVTICNSETPNEEEITRTADILISAVGIPHLVKANWVKEGAVVIDIGINSIPDATRKSGYRLVGDVDYDNVFNKASFITPVPGGVGPMTVVMLMKSVIDSFERSIKLDGVIKKQ